MNELQKARRIHKEVLSKSHFFEHLLTVMEKRKLLSEEDIQSIQLQLIGLLSVQIEKYNHGQSSSIPKQKAEKLMASIYYTLGVYFRSLEDLDQSIELLQQEKIEKMFEAGKKIITEKVARCQALYKQLKEEKLKVDNLAYNDTIDKGIAPFFTDYDVSFGSFETMADIDYPLSLDKMEETGVMYLESYLTKALLENSFCRCFKAEEVEALLEDYHEGSCHLLINIFERVLLNAIGCAFLGRQGLRMTEEERSHLLERMKNLDADQLKLCFNQGADKVMKNLNLQDQETQKYVYQTLAKWQPNIEKQVAGGSLTEIFAAQREEEKGQMTLSGSKNMSDEAFMELTERIRECSSAEEKMEWIRKEIRGVDDLRDLLEADCIYGQEYLYIFGQMSDMELAVLVRFNKADSFGAADLSLMESEREWCTWLRKYLESLDPTQAQQILSISRKISV